MIKLLVVDDQEQNLYMLQVLLQGHGYDVTLASNGAEALEKARQNPPDLIIADILMPVMDGFTLCREWKKDEHLKTIPFVFYTATYTDPKDEKFAMSLGAERFIIKPTDPEKFIDIVQEVIDQCKAGQLNTSCEPIEEEAVFLKQYNETLIHKLEDKITQLEETNQLLEREVRERKQFEEEKKKLEAQLIQAQKMEAIGTLSGGIAHDFNNILSAVIGYTEIALDDAEKGSLLERNLRGVLQAGKRAKNLTKQILTFSRQAELELKPVQVKMVAEEALKFLRASLPTTIDIYRDLASDSLIMGDPTQIHQLLMNLCANAGHAMKENGGILEVILADVELDSNFIAQHPGMIAGPHLKLIVSDTGPGMTTEILKRIFDPYYTTKDKGEGTGLGLSVVHGIIRSNAGAITVYSEPGKGSTFNVFFPVIEEEIRAEAAVEELLPTGNEKILFVDDEPTLVEITNQMLKRLGYDVVTKTASNEALDLFQAQPEKYDLVITDMTMPGMMGDELAGKLMQIRPDIPVILCTGFSQRITEKKAKHLGIKAFLMKPLVMRSLAVTIRKVLDEK
jgi:CheY-like chemotaxis protein